LDRLGSTQINMSNLWLGLWDHDNLIESKWKKNYEIQFLINPILKVEIEKKNQLEKIT